MYNTADIILNKNVETVALIGNLFNKRRNNLFNNLTINKPSTAAIKPVKTVIKAPPKNSLTVSIKEFILNYCQIKI